MKIGVIDNGGQWTHREWRVLKSFEVDAEIFPNTVDDEKLIDLDGLVLSGGPASIESELSKLGNIKQYINHDYPIFGICAGAQFIALNSGGNVSKAVHPEYGKKEVNFYSKGSIFYDIPEKIIVWENHNDEIKSISDDYIICASSDTCRVQAFYHKSRDIFGVQFHPEVNNTEYGTEIFKNFIERCKK
ncbi:MULTISPECIES: GMP synthase subunit A [Acidiplasma]|uniref:GMP synthase n=2 Tax=Acidiplasma aeolicum TaxID=507754 RepID=A0A0Q0VRF8_9ARCH|nr:MULTISPECIES: GMP synthase subunit A [Acidiplasma]KJE49675.1 GMP synthase [Acidiplasma sp. MBA-1]KQB33789.1 GMP synthase [Acidiplasma aeolicum]WMT55761.1 MAG: GMP synthase subunit A [Acidiplasma sp.]